MLTNDPRFVSYSTKTSPELEAVLGRYHAEALYMAMCNGRSSHNI